MRVGRTGCSERFAKDNSNLNQKSESLIKKVTLSKELQNVIWATHGQDRFTWSVVGVGYYNTTIK